MDQPPGQYPDISDILAQKAFGRERRAALKFSTKLDILDAMRARVEPLVRARRMRAAGRMVLQLGETSLHPPDRA